MRKIIFVFVTVLLSILFLVYFLYYDQMVNQITNEQSLQIEEIKEVKVCEVEEDMEEKIQEPEIKPEPQINPNEYMIFEATAYDLSIQCCGKSYSDPARGITKSGYNLNNKSHSEAWVVSSNYFPLGTKLLLEFPQSHGKYTGVYYCRDTGNFAKNVLDVYVGDFGEHVSQEAINFGRVNVKVFVLE
jgi:3D (Asp-Asp-Asp) domain-containing protein